MYYLYIIGSLLPTKSVHPQALRENQHGTSESKWTGRESLGAIQRQGLGRWPVRPPSPSGTWIRMPAAARNTLHCDAHPIRSSLWAQMESEHMQSWSPDFLKGPQFPRGHPGFSLSKKGETPSSTHKPYLRSTSLFKGKGVWLADLVLEYP